MIVLLYSSHVPVGLNRVSALVGVASASPPIFR